MGMWENLLCTALGIILGWLLDLPGKRAARRREAAERTAREQAEAALLAMRRRGDAPLLVPDDSRFNACYTDQGGGKVGWLPCGHAQLLCFNREEVEKDLPAGALVYFLIENRGQEAPCVAVKLDGHPIWIQAEPDMDDRHGFQFLTYPYDPARHGQAQTLEVWFQTRSGFQDTHRYRLVHGQRRLVRVDPQ